MERGFVVRGKLRGRRVELDEPLDGLDGDVELFVRGLPRDTSRAPDILEVIAGLPPGTMSKSDIDVRIQSERGEWDHRG